MLMPIFEGFLTGAFLSLFSYGTVFFMLIKLGIQQGFRKGAFFELGHILSLVLIISVVHFSLLQVSQLELFKKIFSVIGGLFIIGFGIVTYRKKQVAETENVSSQMPLYRYVMSGFLLNLINPLELVEWFGILGAANLQAQKVGENSLLFAGVALLSMAFFDLCKLYLAKKISKKLTIAMLNKLNKFVGVILVGMGLFLLGYFISLVK